jgi:hypothetical protein
MMRALKLSAICMIAFSCAGAFAPAAGTRANTNMDCCNFASAQLGDDPEVHFLVGTVSSPRRSCKRERRYIVTFEKASENIEKHQIDHGLTSHRGVIAWDIPEAKEDFAQDAYYRIKATRTKRCKAAQSPRISGF